MAFSLTIFTTFFLLVIGFCSSSPIMVKFGTNQGPIIPPPAPSPSTTVPSSSYTSHHPAPVYEKIDDVPNPNVYKPLIPSQYRKKIYGYKPNPNLILGTPLDRKYKFGHKYYEDRKFQKAFGLDYKGPQVFVYQDYEQKYEKLGNVKKYTQTQYEKKSYDNNASRDQDTSATKTVPEIGIIYSSGIRYYVPQIVYYNEDDIDNSVYEANDIKYFNHYHKQQNY